jgi:alginate O-acetyltransferase complex protein AlgI
MLFNSIHYLVFFPVTVAAYYACPGRFRWMLLFVASCYFYMAFIPKYILVLFAIIAIDYVAAILIEGANGRKRTIYLWISVAANLGLLAAFKYYNFMNANLAAITGLIGLQDRLPRSDLILPIGLSFHTFQSLSYTLEVYFGRFKAERHLGIYAVYVLFFPQMVAGPIERPYNLLPQLRAHHTFSYERAGSGLGLILFGLFKKIVIADSVAVIVNHVYESPLNQPGPLLLFATYCFAVQIYCDFSGYSDIARGSARIMGIELMRNFNRPYLARSMREFWHRWHISLSTWFRDYVYIPLGGSRTSSLRRAWNLLIVFVLSGLWHGANWTFIIWGALHGGYLIAETWLRSWFPRLHFADSRLGNAARIAITFNLCCFAWIFFRANSISDAFYIAGHLHRGWEVPAVSVLSAFEIPGVFFVIFGGLVLLLLAFEMSVEDARIPLRFNQLPVLTRWSCYWVAFFAALFVFAVVLGNDYESKQFIYFQF